MGALGAVEGEGFRLLLLLLGRGVALRVHDAGGPAEESRVDAVPLANEEGRGCGKQDVAVEVSIAIVSPHGLRPGNGGTDPYSLGTVRVKDMPTIFGGVEDDLGNGWNWGCWNGG